MRGQDILAVSLMVLSLLSCRMESDDVPVPSIKADSVLEVKSRTEIKSVLNGITAATGVVNRVQNALQRGLKQNGAVNGDI